MTSNAASAPQDMNERSDREIPRWSARNRFPFCRQRFRVTSRALHESARDSLHSWSAHRTHRDLKFGL